jgi:Zn-dependent peptidase ImmA (M78 family)
MRMLAVEVRAKYGFATPRVLRSDLRRIYRDEGIRIDLWPYKMKKLRGAYFNDADGASVLLAKSLPQDPMVFTMGHELKHHLVDRDKIVALCDTSNKSAEIEIGAEIFAAELIYPEDMFRADLTSLGVLQGSCTARNIVDLKRQTDTTLSYAGLSKRAEFLGFAPLGTLARVAWKKLEESIYGIPFYKQRLLKS